MGEKAELIKFFSELVKEERLEQMLSVLSNRTRYITVVLEDIFQPQNASAVLRTCDCFGIQDVNVIENRNEYNVNPDVVRGADKWLDMHKYNKHSNNTLEAINELKNKGYRIIATTPHTNDQKLEEFDLSAGKSAFVFGTELTGVSEIVKANADGFMKIPMYGFTESFNVSVSAAIALHYLTYQLRNSNLPWKLTKEEYDDLLLNWLKKSIRRSHVIEKEFLTRNK